MPAFFPTQGNAAGMHFKKSRLDFLWQFFRYYCSCVASLHGAFGADHQLEVRR